MKKKQQNAMSSAQEAIPAAERPIAEWLRNVKFKHKVFGGVDEADVWRKIEELNALYEKLLISQKACGEKRTEEVISLVEAEEEND